MSDISPGVGAAPEGSRVIYHIHLDPQHSSLEVRACLPHVDPAQATLFLPVWTPGSYLVREFARQLEAVELLDDGIWRPCNKCRKNAWQLPVKAAGPVQVRYRLYAHELSVRTNYVSDSFALLVGAATFLAHAPSLGLPHVVHLALPEAYAQALCALPAE
ncbi:MAG: hypothetical protein EOO78_11320, partial [Oxalobacteraceae bacterium]